MLPQKERNEVLKAIGDPHQYEAMARLMFVKAHLNGPDPSLVQSEMIQGLSNYIQGKPDLQSLWNGHKGVISFFATKGQLFMLHSCSAFVENSFQRSEEEHKSSLADQLAAAQTEWVKVLRVRAQAMGFSDDSTGKMYNCYVCGKETPLMCKHCDKVHYCSKKCQRENLIMHKNLFPPKLMTVCGLFVNVISQDGKRMPANTLDEFTKAISTVDDKNLLVFGMELPFHHHCTISFIHHLRGEPLMSAARSFYEVWEKERKKLCVKAIGKDTFNEGKTNVILLQFNSQPFNEAYQAMSQAGTQEGPSATRVPHMSYWMDGPANKQSFLKMLLASIKS